MRTRWQVNDRWLGLGVALVGLGWIPASLIGNDLAGGNSDRMTWGFWAGIGVVWIPPLLPFAPRALRWLLALGLPVRRVREPILDDLRGQR